MNGSSRATRAAIAALAHREARARCAAARPSDGVGGEEGVGEHQPAVRRVVEAALEPLGRGVERAVQRVGDQPAREAAHALGAHRVALVGHRRRADLLVVERLGELADALQQAQVGAASCGSSRRCRRAPRARWLSCLRGVGLAGDREAAGEAEPRGEPRGRARAPCAWSPSKRVRKLACVPVVPLTPRQRRRREPMVDLVEVEHEVLQPEAGALADGGELRRLEVGVGEAGERPRCRRAKSASARERRGQPPAQQPQRRRASAARSVLSVTKALVAPRWRMPPRRLDREACSAKWRRCATTSWRVWRSISATRSRSSAGAACSQGRDLRRRDRQAELGFGLGERDPEPAPGARAVRGGEERRHLARGVALVERILRRRSMRRSPVSEIVA